MSDLFLSDYLKESINPDIDRYLMELLPARDNVLMQMEKYATERDFPFIGPLVGNVLGIIARAVNARLVFELGSGFGYSAIHFARAMQPGGKVICTDGDPDNKRQAEEYFRQAGLSESMEFHVGDAVKVMDEFAGPFDIVLMDIDKEGYPDGFRAAWPKVRPGGLFIADNLFWHGSVFTKDQKPSTQGIRKLTELLHSTPGARTTILPLRDGVSLTVKL